MPESLGLNKAQGLKKEKASSGLENEIKQLRTKSSGFDKARGLKRKKQEKRVSGSKEK